MISLTKIVTDGKDKWLETQRFFWISKREAQHIFKQWLVDNNLTEVK